MEERLSSKDYAIDLFRRGFAAKALSVLQSECDKHDPEVMVIAGSIFEMGGVGLDANPDEAISYYNKAIHHEDIVAAYYGLVRIHYKRRDELKSCSLAKEYCKLLVDECDDPYAMFHLGLMSMRGECGERSLAFARDCFESVWAKGYVFGLTYLAKLDAIEHRWIRSVARRVKAGVLYNKIARENEMDWRVRSPLSF